MDGNLVKSRVFEKVSVIGLGYIGLPTAAVLASKRIHVVGVDINQTIVEHINKGMTHIVEPELDIVVRASVTEGYLRATTTPEASDAFLIAVPTPCNEDHQPDLSYLKSACETIAPVLRPGDLVILESTSPVGTTEMMSEWLAEIRSDLSFPHTYGENSDIRLAYCPERVLPGHVLRELIQNDRVIGGLTSKCSMLAASLYQVFVEGECIITNSRTAEMCKLTENSFRDVNIAFANELSMICDNLNINVWDLIQLTNRHPRVKILQPGPGVGGHCIAVDPWFIVSSNPEKSKLIRTAREVNDSKPEWVIDKVKIAIAEVLSANPNKRASDLTIACFGLAFKADIDDLRESPALQIVKYITEIHAGFTIVIEPFINELPSCLNGRVELGSMESAFEEADVLVMLVNHKAFIGSHPNIRPESKVVDCRGIWMP